MKLQLTFKTPNVVANALEVLYQEACYDPETQCDCGGHCVDCDRLADTFREDAEALKQKATRAIDKFVRYGEYIIVEIDTDDETCKVMEAPQRY